MSADTKALVEKIALDKNAIITEIEADLKTKLDEPTKERFESIFSNDVDYTIYCLMRQHHSEQLEIQYQLLERILDRIKAIDPKNYMEALQTAFNRVKEYCMNLRENKIAPYLRPLLKQIKNIEPEMRKQYFDLIRSCFFECYIKAHTSEDELAKTREYVANSYGGSETQFYNEMNKWPAHIIVQSVQEVLPEITEVLVAELRRNFKAEEMTIEQAVASEVNKMFSPANVTRYWMGHINQQQSDIVNYLIAEWEKQFAYQTEYHNLVFQFFEPNLQMKLANTLAEYTMQYSEMQPHHNFMPQYVNAQMQANGGAAAGDATVLLEVRDTEASASSSASSSTSSSSAPSSG